MNNVVEPVDTILAIVDVRASGVKKSKVHFIGILVCCWWWSIDFAESPDTEDFVACLRDLTEGCIYIRVLAQVS